MQEGDEKFSIQLSYLFIGSFDQFINFIAYQTVWCYFMPRV